MAAPGTYPVPSARGRWRLTLHNRSYSDQTTMARTGLTELTDARSRRLVQALNTPAVLTFTLDGHSPNAALVTEMAMDVMAWRWDDQQGQDVLAFRGIVAQSQDTLSEQTATVTFTCHDYLAMLTRRFRTTPLVYTQTDQDDIAAAIVATGRNIYSSSGVSLNPGSYLPILPVNVDPAGASRSTPSHLGSPPAPLRDRTFPAQSVLLESLDALAKVQGGFDYDLAPGADVYGYDRVRIFYPYQGVLRTFPQLMYGSTVSTVTRTVLSSDYANYQRVLGNNGSSDPAAPQLFAEAWNTAANNVTVSPQGLWMAGEAAADVTLQQTLADKANGDLGRSGLVTPGYAVGLRPDGYSWGNPNMGDVVPLIIQAGRLNVNTTIRVLGITYDIGDAGQEDVSLVLGRPDTTFADIFAGNDQDIQALIRR